MLLWPYWYAQYNVIYDIMQDYIDYVFNIVALKIKQRE